MFVVDPGMDGTQIATDEAVTGVEAVALAVVVLLLVDTPFGSTGRSIDNDSQQPTVKSQEPRAQHRRVAVVRKCRVLLLVWLMNGMVLVAETRSDLRVDCK